MPKGKGYGMKGKMRKKMKGSKKGTGMFKGNAMSRSAMKADMGKSTMKRTSMGKV